MRAFLSDLTEAERTIVWLDRFDPHHYWRKLGQVWLEGRSFIALEHDVLPTREQLEAIWACPEPWCAYPYDTGVAEVTGLGCTKFSRSLIAAVPEALDQAGRLWHGNTLGRYWTVLDVCLARALQDEGISGPHEHRPAVTHLKPGIEIYPPTCWHCGRRIPECPRAVFRALKRAEGGARCADCGGPFFQWRARLATLRRNA